MTHAVSRTLEHRFDLDRTAVTLRASLERWPLAAPFRIARGAKTEAVVVVVEARAGSLAGWGEAVPYARYRETPDSVLASLTALATAGPKHLESLAGTARTAVETALLDLEAQRTGVPVHERLGLPAPVPFPIAATVSIDAPDVMASRASVAPGSLLKLKLAGDGDDLARLRAVASARRDARLWLDANEGLDERSYDALVPALASLRVVLLEQPLPEGHDAVLARAPRPVPICADESAHGAASIDALAGRYDAVNVKLQKAGGLVAALRAIERARALDLKVVLGCMVSTSLAIAPAALLAPLADFVDLDGALFLSRDREGGGRLKNGLFVPPTLWGVPR